MYDIISRHRKCNICHMIFKLYNASNTLSTGTFNDKSDICNLVFFRISYRIRSSNIFLFHLCGNNYLYNIGKLDRTHWIII